jgi:hypothetical protein
MNMGSLCIYRAHELTKFIIFFEKITNVLSILLHRCIKFQVKTHYSLSITKKEISDRFLTTYLSENLFFYCSFVIRNLNMKFYTPMK